MDAIRTTVEAELKQQVVFIAKKLAVCGEWALLETTKAHAPHTRMVLALKMTGCLRSRSTTLRIASRTRRRSWPSGTWQLSPATSSAEDGACCGAGHSGSGEPDSAPSSLSLEPG
jgi:hypothetical protein